ncbi:transposase [Streptomyces sp. NPDC005181]|uniref:transposase n=1 Tax=Streptomyces sp. NPDC005181 TaxID=3156869 RepID=UPI00339E11EE
MPERTAVIARRAFPKGSLPMRVRDRLQEVFSDEPFAAGFGVRGAPALSPGVLALVTVLQFAEDLTDRQAAAMAVRAIDWKYAIGVELDDPGFDFTVLSKFRARLANHGMERVVFDRLLEHCRAEGLVAAGGKQRTDSTHVISAVRDLNRLELAGESVRAALEALAVAAPAWLAGVVDIAEFAHRYGPDANTCADRAFCHTFGRGEGKHQPPATTGPLPTSGSLRESLQKHRRSGDPEHPFWAANASRAAPSDAYAASALRINMPSSCHGPGCLRTQSPRARTTSGALTSHRHSCALRTPSDAGTHQQVLSLRLTQPCSTTPA